MHIAICDDQLTERRQLYAMLETYFVRRSMKISVDVFSSADSFLADFTKDKFQIVFLDIYMPGLSGIDAARRIRESDQAISLIFTTCSPDHALESYAYYAAGYLLKPYTDEQLAEVLDWCLDHASSALQTITISCQHEKMTLPVNEIVFFEIYGRECTVHATSHSYTTNRSLNDLEAQLPGSFLRCHRSFIVNMDYITRLNAMDFTMADKFSVPISNETAAHIKQSYFDYMFRKTWEGR